MSGLKANTAGNVLFLPEKETAFNIKVLTSLKEMSGDSEGGTYSSTELFRLMLIFSDLW